MDGFEGYSDFDEQKQPAEESKEKEGVYFQKDA